MLDDNVVALGIHRTGEANWRIACENGFDNAHILVHKDNTIVQSNNWVLPLGIRPASEDCITIFDEADGPKGMMQWLFTDRWEPILENKALDVKVEGLNSRLYRTSIILPGVYCWLRTGLRRVSPSMNGMCRSPTIPTSTGRCS